MDTGQVLLLAVVQGVTEFLPVSSSAHLAVIPVLTGYPVQPVLFDIAVHAATLFAVLAYFARDIRDTVVGSLAGDREKRSHLAALVFATAPILIVGWLVYPFIDSFRAVPYIAGALIISGCFLCLSDAAARSGVRINLPEKVRGFGVGVFQIFALIPGVSRSGITIAAGRLFGFSRTQAARFSLLLAVPTIAAALGLALLRVPESTGVPAGSLVLGGVIACITAFAVIHTFLRLVERFGFLPFFIYQVSLGVFLLF